jgi:glycosyltransferase involved in cell wall biosynthesis
MKASVALCTYNGEKYLTKQLDSYLQQTRLPDEIIICDDCSKDSTLAILEEFKCRTQIKVSIIRNDHNIGVIQNFEKVIGLCSGDLIFLSDQDDIWKKNKIETYLNFFGDHPDSLLLFSNAELINEYDKPLSSTLWEKWNFTPEIRKQWLDNKNAYDFLIRNDNKITGATVAIRSDLKKHIFPFSVPKGSWQDTWLGIHASKNNGLFFIEDSLIQYRVHPDQLIGIGDGIAIRKNKKNVFDRIKKIISGSLKKVFK